MRLLTPRVGPLSTWSSASLATAVMAVSGFALFLVGALGVRIRAELGLTASGFGLVLGVFHLAAASSSAYLGRLAERLGPLVAMRTATLVAGGSLAGIAVLARTPMLLAGLLVLAGISFSLAQPATNLFIARAVAPGRRGVVLGVKHAAIPASTMLAGLSVPAIALTIGWRWAFAIGSSIAVVLALSVPSRFVAEAEVAPGDTGGRSSTSQLLVLAGAVTLAMFGGGALGAFLVSFGVESGLPEARAGILLAVGAATGITVRVGAGWVADRRNTGSLWGIALLLGIGTLGYVLLSTGQAVLLYAGAVLAFGGALGWSGLLAHGVVSRNLAKPARATGIIQIGFYTGGGLGPPVFGRLIDTYSYATAWRAAAVAALVAGLLAVVVELRTDTIEL